MPPSIIIGSMLNTKTNNMVAKFSSTIPAAVISEGKFINQFFRCAIFNCRKNKFGYLYQTLHLDDDNKVVFITIGLEKFVSEEVRDEHMFRFTSKLLSHLTPFQIKQKYPNLWTELQKRNLLKQ